MKLKTLTIIGLVLFTCWLVLTLWVQSLNNTYTVGFNLNSNIPKAILIFDNDPLSEFDENICHSFANGLAQQNWSVKVSSVFEAKKDSIFKYDLFIVCANTYNFAPDWAISRFIKNTDCLKNKPVVAITLGAGSSQRAQRLLEEQLMNKEANLINSHAFWLMRPNDESRLLESNTQVALEMAFEAGKNTPEHLYLHSVTGLEY